MRERLVAVYNGCMPTEQIYLDCNATTPILPEVLAAMTECESIGYANPGSQHAAGRRARKFLEDAREGIARVLGADLNSRQPDQVIFTSGGTEANNLAIFGLAEAAGSLPRQPQDDQGIAGVRPAAIVSAIEHPSVVGAARRLEEQGWEIRRLGVTADGTVNLQELPGLLTPQTRFASVMLANNETGVLQPVQEIAEQCAAAGVPLHTDAVQACGKLPVDFRALNVAGMTVAAHKFHGPRGIGALIVRQGSAIRPHLFGGFQQAGLRPGTECVSLAVGMHAALDLWQRRAGERIERLTALQHRLECQLRAGWPTAVIHGERAPRLPQTTCVAFPGIDRQALVMALDLAGVACSTGSACASGSSEPSPVIQAMNCPAEVLAGSIRLSWGATTTEADIDRAADHILRVCKDLELQNRSRKIRPAMTRPAACG